MGEWEPGVVIDDYLLEDKLGAGGMGAVFLARHVTTGAQVAIKTLTAQADLTLRERFQREGQAQARVDGHPNVLRIHSAGTVEGKPFIVMDLARGGDLEERLRTGPLPPREAALLVRNLARGLEHVHRQGILHRDLKPQNVLFDERGHPKLVDFGLARLQGVDRMTQTGELLGTPNYMAPEQAMGIQEDVGQAADVYGLGAILYASLTGRPPFSGSSALDILHRVCTEAPTPPSRHGPVPAELEAIVLRALAKEPSKRHGSAGELGEALEAWLGGGSQGSRRPLALVAGVVALGVAFGVWSSTAPSAEVPTTVDEPPTSEPPPSVLPTRPTKTGAELRAELLAGIDIPDPKTAPAGLTTAWLRAHWESGLLPPANLGQNLLKNGHPDLALQWFALAARGSAPVPGADMTMVRAVDQALGWLELGKVYVDEVHAERDEPLAMACFEEALRLRHPGAAHNLGNLYRHRNPPELSAAATAYLEGLRILDERPDDDVGSISSCALMLFQVYQQDSEVVEADVVLAALRRTLAMPPNPNRIDRHRLRIAQVIYKERMTEAIEEAVALLRAVLPSPGAWGDEAATTLTSFGRDTWCLPFRIERAERTAILKARLREIPPARTEAQQAGRVYELIPQLRVRYQLGLELTLPPPPRDEARAAQLWRSVADEDRADSWLHFASLKNIAELGESEDPAVRDAAAKALAELKPAVHAGDPSAVRVWGGGLKMKLPASVAPDDSAD